MYSEVISGMTLGIGGMFVRVETDISPGLPMLSMVGYLASSVKEAGERVRTAVKNSGFILPASSSGKRIRWYITNIKFDCFI